MKRKYLALLLAAVTAVSQTAGTATVGAAAEVIIAEPEAVQVDAAEAEELQAAEAVSVSAEDSADVENSAGAEQAEASVESPENADGAESSEESASAADETEVSAEIPGGDVVDNLDMEFAEAENTAADEVNDKDLVSEESNAEDMNSADEDSEEELQESVRNIGAGESDAVSETALDAAALNLGSEVVIESLEVTEEPLGLAEYDSEDDSVNIEYYGPEDQVLLPGWDYQINRDHTIFYMDAEGNQCSVPVTAVELPESQSTVTLEQGDGYWKIYAHEPGEVEIGLTYTKADGETNGNASFVISITECVPSIYIENSTGLDWLTPGQSFELNAQACMEAWNSQENHHYRDGSNKIQLEARLLGDAADVITIEENAEDGSYWSGDTIYKNYTVSVNSGAQVNSSACIRFTAYPVDENDDPLMDGEEYLWSVTEDYWVNIGGGYTNLLPVTVEQMPVESTQTVSAQYREYRYQEDGSTSDNFVSNVRYRWEWDPEKVQISYRNAEEEDVTLNTENAAVISDDGVDFTLKKLDNDDTRLTLFAGQQDENGAWQEQWRRDYWLGQVDYIYNIQELSGEGIRDFDGRIFESETCTLTYHVNDLVGEDTNWKTEWQVGLCDENGEYTTLLGADSGAYAVSEDTRSITLNGAVIGEKLNLEDRNWFNVNAVITAGDMEVDNEGCGIEFRKDNYELQNVPWVNQDVIRGWDDSFGCYTEAWVENAQFPDGENVAAKITDMQITDGTSLSSGSEEWEDGNGKNFWLKAASYGESTVMVTYQLAFGCDEEGNPVYEGDYHFKYQVNVCGDRYGAEITSDRGINGFTNLKPGESVTLYAEPWSEYEYWPESGEQYPEITMAWSADENLVTLEPDGTACKVTAKENLNDEHTRVEARVMVQWPDQEQAYERACEGWDINIHDGYFYVTLANGQNFRNELETGESVTVWPCLMAGGTAELPEQFEWRWEDWDTERLAIQDGSGKTLSPEDNGGAAPFTLTKLSPHWTDIRLKAYTDGYLTEARFDFPEQNYDISYEGLKEDGWTWFFTDDQNPVIALNTENLQDKDKYEIEWYLGCYDEEGNPVEGLQIEEGSGYTVSDDSTFITLNLPAVRSWLNEKNIECPAVHVRVVSGDEVLAAAHHADVWVHNTVCEYNIDLGQDGDGVIKPMAGDGWWLNESLYAYVENASMPEGEEIPTQITDVELVIGEEWPQKAILLEKYEAQNEEEASGWNIQYLNPCEGIIKVTYLTLDGTTAAAEFPVEVQGEGYYFDFIELGDELLVPGDEMTITVGVKHCIQGQEAIADDTNVSVRWSIAEQRDKEGQLVESGIIEMPEQESDRTRTLTAVAEGEAVILLTAYLTDDEGNEIIVREREIWLNVNNYKIRDAQNASREQYADFGQYVTVSPALYEGNEVYEGPVLYTWEFPEGNVKAYCDGNEVTVIETEAGKAAPDINLTRCGGGWGRARLIAYILRDDEWQDVTRLEWYFNEYDESLWMENTREDHYTWFYSDEGTSSLTMGYGNGLLENGRELVWTVGLQKDGELVDGKTFTDYTTGGEKENTISINCAALAVWLEENQTVGEEPFIEANVEMEVDNGEGGTETVIAANYFTGFEVRESVSRWVDEEASVLLLGASELRYTYDGNDFITTWEYVENAENPWGNSLPYELKSVTSSDESVLKVNTSETMIQVVPTGTGTATLKYAAVKDGQTITYEHEKEVIGSKYSVRIVPDSGSVHMKQGESQKLKLVVAEETSVQKEDDSWTTKAVPLTENQYTVAFEDLTEGRLAVAQDGTVTVLDDSEDWAAVKIIITVPQGDDQEPRILELIWDFSLEKSWYEIEADTNYAAVPGNSVTVVPKLYYVENDVRTLQTNVTFTLEEIWGNNNVAFLENGDGTFTVTANTEEETSSVFRITASMEKDMYGYYFEMSKVCWVVFCEHQYDEEDWQISYWSTCSEPGLKEYYCEKCGWIMAAEKIPTLEHTWDEGTVTKEATCTVQGEKTFTCTVCKTGAYKEVIPAIEHQAGSWETIKTAACTATGLKVQKCTICGTQLGSQTIPKLAHTPGSWSTTVQPTCIKTGTEVQKCMVCSTVLGSKTIPAKGHTWSSFTVTTQPTAVSEGWETRTCSTCKTSDGRAVAKLTPTIKLTEKKLTLQLKKSAAIGSIVTGLAAGDYIAGWKSSNTKIVTVSKSGKITGKKIGTADITITLKSGLTGKVSVTVQKKAVKTKKVTVEDRTITLQKGKKVTLKPIVTPITSLEKATYKSSNKKVATVNSKGQVVAKASGKAIITIKVGKKSVKVTVTVPKIQPTRITGVISSKTLKKGRTLTLKPKLSPKGSEATIKYTSSDKKVAVVNSRGKITAKKKGTAVITVKAGKVTATCKITVK